MLRTQISLNEEMYEKARAEAARQGISIAELVRRALAAQLSGADARRPWMRHAGAVASGDTGASRSVDAILYGRGRP
jgi:hypothetical protein